MSSSNISHRNTRLTIASLAVGYLRLGNRCFFLRKAWLVTAVIVFLTPLCGAKQAGERYTNQLFAEALISDGLILVSKQTLPQCMNKHVCITARALIGAIHQEYRLSFDAADEQRALAIADRYYSRVVTFRERSARENVDYDYSCSQLDTARNALAKFSNSELRRQLRPVDSPLHRLYFRSGDPTSMLYAVAHAVLERGVLVGITDNSGMLREITAER